MQGSRVAISMLEFLKTGRFGPIADSLTREQLVETLGRPDTHLLISDDDPRGPPATDATTSAVWKYGSFEFHFDGGRVAFLFADGFQKLREGRRLRIDPWLMFGGMGQDRFKARLRVANIAFSERTAHYDPDQTLIMTEGGVELSFVTNTDIYSRLGLEALTRRWNVA